MKKIDSHKNPGTDDFGLLIDDIAAIEDFLIGNVELYNQF